MRNWDEMFAKNLRHAAKTDYLKQVGHTVGGKSVSQVQFDSMVAQIIDLMQLSTDDNLLDICCGNGIFTKQLASKVKHVTGIDFCQPLVDIAIRDHGADNIDYHCMDARQLEQLEQVAKKKFNKIVMYAALQHFKPQDLSLMLNKLSGFIDPKPLLFIGFVPDRKRKWFFYNTPKRKIEHIVRNTFDRDNFGHWWDSKTLDRICAPFNLKCSFSDLPQGLHATSYRFNILIQTNE